MLIRYRSFLVSDRLQQIEYLDPGSSISPVFNILLVTRYRRASLLYFSQQMNFHRGDVF